MPRPINFFRKGGIPALAFLTSDAGSSCRCWLAIKCSEDGKSAAIRLRFLISIHGFDDEQHVSLLYDGDNMVPGSISLQSTTTRLQQAWVREIARQSGDDLRTLSIAIKKHCSVLCPPSSEDIAPKHGDKSHFYQLVHFAKATSVHVVFDYGWVHNEKRTLLEDLVSYPEELTSFSAHFLREPCRRVDWTVFNLGDNAVSDLPPPPYVDVSNKRKREIPTGSPKSQVLKRIHIPPESVSVPSPTEPATPTASMPSPWLPSSPHVSAPHFQDTVKNTLDALLPKSLEAALSDSLSRVLAPCVEAILRQLITDMVEHGADVRNLADVKFSEYLEDRKLDVTMHKEDCIAELDDICNAKLEELREGKEEIIKDIESRAAMAYNDTHRKIKGLRDTELKGDRSEVKEAQHERRGLVRRASSLPVGMHGTGMQG